jgi:hypothetical protein
MDYLIVEEVAEENGISVTMFYKFLEIHLKHVGRTGKMMEESKLRYRIKQNFGDVSDDVFNVIMQEMKLIGQ